MASVTDDRGYNQGFIPSKALEVRTNRRCEAIIDTMQINASRKSINILEIGCGTGELSNLLFSKTIEKYKDVTDIFVTGCDICEPFIDQAIEKFRKDRLNYVKADLSSSDFYKQVDKKFDFIVGNGILHHLYYSLDSVLPHLKDALAPQGKLIFWEPNFYNPYVMSIFNIPFLRNKAKLEPDEMAFTKRFIKNKLQVAGYLEIDISYRDFLLPNAPVFAIAFSMAIGNVIEKIPVLNMSAQSIFITAGIS